MTVRKTIAVQAPRERAFEVFTGGIGGWWPADKRIGAQPMETAIIEGRAGGRWYERAADGSECDWGRVLAWEPPSRVVLSWQIGADWRFDPDPERGSEIEVRFVAEGPASTRVELEHRGIERHGDGAEAVRATVDSPSGWAGVLRAYAAAISRT